MKTRLKNSTVLLALLLLAAFVLPLFAGEYYIHIGVLVLFYAYMAVAWNILGGYAGQHSLGHALFMGIGAYTSTYLFTVMGLTPWLGMWLGGALAGIAGWFVGYLCFRYGLKGPYFALVTIAMAEAAVYLANNITAIGGAQGLEVAWTGSAPLLMQFDGKSGYYYVILVMTVVARFPGSSGAVVPTGFIRENDDGGVPWCEPCASRSRLRSSAHLTALAGLFAQYYVHQSAQCVRRRPSIQILLLQLGGLDWGPVVGALVLVPIADVRGWLGGPRGASCFMAQLVLVMLFCLNGLVEKRGRSRAAVPTTEKLAA
jgi:branched-chain amino acid transport system permease protein